MRGNSCTVFAAAIATPVVARLVLGLLAAHNLDQVVGFVVVKMLAAAQMARQKSLVVLIAEVEPCWLVV